MNCFCFALYSMTFIVCCEFTPVSVLFNEWVIPRVTVNAISYKLLFSLQTLIIPFLVCGKTLIYIVYCLDSNYIPQNEEQHKVQSDHQNII